MLSILMHSCKTTTSQKIWRTDVPMKEESYVVYPHSCRPNSVQTSMFYVVKLLEDLADDDHGDECEKETTDRPSSQLKRNRQSEAQDDFFFY